MIYAFAGYANAKINIDHVDFADPSNNDSLSGTTGGFRVGAGVKRSYDNGIYGTAEYRYASYTKYDPSLDFDAGFNRHTIMVATGYRS